jgi:enduracididine biosynthesis enzyme MppP
MPVNRLSDVATVGVGLNLTEYEVLGIDAPINVADGHARQPLTDTQAQVIDELPQIFAAAHSRPIAEVEREAHVAYLSAVGQHGAPVGTDRILTTYSSSVAMDILARCLGEAGATVALIHPTFDNIPDLLRSRGVRLVPFEEPDIAAAEIPAEIGPGDCVFITTPNNPTGVPVPPEQLEPLAVECRDRGALLALDTSFRGFDERAQYDHYRLLTDIGVDHVIVEDTGKLWPMLELKLGLLVFSEDLALPLRKAYSDILLTASPLIMKLVTHLAADAVAGGFQAMRAGIAENRLLVLDRLAAAAMRTPDGDSKVSVLRVELPGANASEVAACLAAEGVHVLPCGPFYWNRPADGERYIRVALARPRETVERAAERLVAVATAA